MKAHLTSLFKRITRRDETFRVSRANNAYSFFQNEYPNHFSTDSQGNLIIRNDEGTLKALKDHFDRIIDVGSSTYGYFLNEYRQNSPVRDNYGNIILNDDIVQTMHK